MGCFIKTISSGACDAHIRGIASVTSQDTLMISRVDTFNGSVTMIMNRTLCGISRKNMLDTDEILASVYDGSTCFVTCELNHHHVVTRDHR